MADDDCELECVKNKRAKLHEFVGPVRIVLVTTPAKRYCAKTFSAAVIVVAYFFLGATSMGIIFFTLSFILRFPINMHILLCTMGYQVLIPTGVLMFNHLNGPSAFIGVRGRKLEHAITQCAAVVFGYLGSLFAIMFSAYEMSDLFTTHGVFGFATGFGCGVSMLFGPMTYLVSPDHPFSDKIKTLHLISGVFTLISSFFCFSTGIVKPVMDIWYFPVLQLKYILILFCIFYTAVIAYRPIKNHVRPVNKTIA